VTEAARAAVASDVPALTRLLADALAELTPMRGGALWRAGRDTVEFATEIDDDSRLVCAGTLDDVVVGDARVRVDDLVDGVRVGVIEDRFVELGGREVGVGEAMMGVVLDWCRARGCSGVDAIALPGHRATKNFFEESGFTARLLVMHTELDDAARADA
jgi:GNAT superfamily N-acetyltransferase